jgi:exportin-2 (importin alpha re-exporter)
MEVAEVRKSLVSDANSDNSPTVQLYTNRFPELFTSTSSIGPFVQAVWALVGDGKRPSVADDTVR